MKGPGADSKAKPPGGDALPPPGRRLDLPQDDPRWHRPRARSGPAKAVAIAAGPGDAEEPPRIVATGKSAVAEQILQLAFAHGVKVREDPDLVEILALLEVDSDRKSVV